MRTRKNYGDAETEIFSTDAKGIAARYGVGISTARRIGEESGAKVMLGNRALYLVEKTDAYIRALNEANKTEQED